MPSTTKNTSETTAWGILPTSSSHCCFLGEWLSSLLASVVALMNDGTYARRAIPHSPTPFHLSWEGTEEIDNCLLRMFNELAREIGISVKPNIKIRSKEQSKIYCLARRRICKPSFFPGVGPGTKEKAGLLYTTSACMHDRVQSSLAIGMI